MTAPDPARTARRSLVTWLVTCVAGAGFVLLAAGRAWATFVFNPLEGTPGPGKVALVGSELVPFLTPAALAGLAATAAVLATRGLPRRLIGAVIALCGAAVMAGSWTGTRAETIAAVAREHATVAMIASGGFAGPSVTWLWPLASVAGGVVLVAGGAMAVVRGGRWPGMSGRYDRHGRGRARRHVSGERALWDAIDEGADPTADSAADPTADFKAESITNDKAGGTADGRSGEF
ncbi:Trp biosynthesis-associated membrane protein [Planotetraspora sp. A-T 1434]|uniref:Trp biosynthesis-associated membrane protein n=1 Tax=Planotetraspora sp. A-T 1434 TaxID=2979219 RepID=UPI0021BFA9BF|nr:Trp biosynthesis-associated membrane protein [Planotetraspora sp. A-T 1434]MCT9930598.1 Trp biosynthesis-associated membrane protein [Planotetraspora sp. A-T 1434]